MRILRLTCILASVLKLMAGAPSPGSYTLAVEVTGVSNSKGVVGVLLFDTAEGWPERVSAARRSAVVPSRAGRTELIFEGLAAGEYAVVVLHDENENMRLDRNWLGMPSEQWGMSNNPRYSLSAPSFEEARFRIDADRRLPIKLN